METMDKEKNTRKGFSFYPSGKGKEIMEKLHSYCAERGIKKTFAIQRAVEEWLEKQK